MGCTYVIGFLVVLCSLCLVVLCSSKDCRIETFAGSCSGDGGNATSAALYYPYGVAVSSSNEIYIADTGNHRIRKISTSGIITTIAGTGIASFSEDGGLATKATLNNPRGIAVSSSNEIYIVDTGNQRIRKISTSGIITTIAGTGTASFSGDGGNATSASLSDPYGVAVSSSNEIYIADTGNHRIRKISTSGIITTIAGTGIASFSGDRGYATNATLSHPHGVAISSSNEIYIADTTNQRIRKISASGIITTMVGTGIASFSGDGDYASNGVLNNPYSIAISSSNEIYIADTYNHRIRKIFTSGISGISCRNR